MIMAKKVPRDAAFFLSTTVYLVIVQCSIWNIGFDPSAFTKTFLQKKSFLIWQYLSHYLSLSGNSDIIGKITFWTFSCETLFIFEKNLSYHFLNKNYVFFYHIKKYHFSNSNQKIFFCETSNCIDSFAKSIWIKISSLTMFWVSELHLVFKSWKTFHFL